MSLLPRSLFGRVALVVFAGLALAHGLTFLALLRERSELSQSMMLAYVGRDVSSAVAILDRVPPAERAAWLPRLARQNYSYALDTASPAAPAAEPSAQGLARIVAAELGAARVGAILRGTGSDLLLPLRLEDGTPLILRLRPPAAMISTEAVVLLLVQLLFLAAATWWGVRLAVRPLQRLADAADALKPGGNGAVLAEAGPREVAQAARAFNAMQQRIDAHLAERQRLLAAISHDLQTPITRMKLRVEQVLDADQRSRLLSDLDGMQLLVEEGLAYARTSQAVREPLRAVDLNALLDGLVCDALDAGHQAELLGRHEAPLTTRVQALRRALTNLLDNALKFGGAAQVVVEVTAHEVHISVRDRGPGIPEAELAPVLQPFYRVESSRNRETGGTGLGLAIAQELALALNGRLSLSNRAGGGLEARLSLPSGF
ncbi:ATP-binding protein [Variovorax sp. RT4R15]|uniref:ATP-binding protein n=1 Tax=Variovorax sp. RT4R15 TaxID=3443737 RepID=UPI003F44BB20